LLTAIANYTGANRTVLALSIARLGDAVGNSILFIVIPLYVAKLPAPWFPFPETVLVGLLISLFGLVNSALQPLMGAVTDRVSRRKPFIMGGLLLMGLGTLAFAFAHQFVSLVLIRALQGIGVALTIPASLALMAAATEKRTRGGSMGIYTTMRMVGFAIGPLLGGFLHVQFGFTAAFYMASAFSMMTTLEKQFNTRLDQTALGFGIAFSALMISRLIFQIPLGRLSDYIGRKPIIIAGLLLMAPTTMLIGLVSTTFQLTGVRLFQGLASAGIAAPAFALAADLSRGGGEGRQMSIITMGFGLGVALGPLIAGLLAIYFFELPFFIGGLMSLVGAWIVYRYVPESIRRQGEQSLS
jgi:MFS family permease